MAKRTKPSATDLPNSIPLQAGAAVILYNRRTGAIFATHHFGAAEGVELPDKDELERIARSLAAKDGCDERTHKALHVDPSSIQRGVSYRVSIANGALVEVKTRSKGPRPLSARAPKKTPLRPSSSKTTAD